MRLNEEEEVSYESDDSRVDDTAISNPYSVGGLSQPNKSVVVVGYALTSKKIKSFLQPKFERLARNKGIYFVAIDPKRPLSEQGPFDIVLQKVNSSDFTSGVLGYLEKNGAKSLRALAPFVMNHHAHA